MRVLLVDDDREVAEYVRRELEEEDLSVVVAHDGASGLRLAETSAFDIIVLDVMMPFMDGLQVTRNLRRQKILTPILLLTGRDAPEEIVRGLDAGADDYLTKPFSFDVLLARIRARTRRPDQQENQLRFADLLLDLDEHKAWRGNRAMTLTRTEFSILECLLRSAGRVVTRDRLIETVWSDREVSDNNLDVFIKFLRSKVDVAGESKLIHTERGLGYSLRQDGSVRTC
ncbi:MAG TPA: response regulator transcription factor [Bryobacteraceae bacterium]|jgi:DNA-binding response OmpR family regulator|nr:response regulator transcription factor [Bryobacteraceae bacterium]